MVKGIIVFYFFQRNDLVVNEKQKVRLSYDLKKVVKIEGKFKGTKKRNAILPVTSRFNENKFRTITDIRLNNEKADNKKDQ